MPGVSAEEQNLFSMDTFMPGSFFSSDNVYTHGSNNGNGEFLPPGLDFVEHLPDSERSSPRIMAREDVNFNNRRFFTKSLSFGSNPSFNDDFPHPMDQNFPENGSYSDAAAKDEAFMSAPNGNYGAMAGVSSDALAALQKFLPSNNEDEASWPAVDVYSCDEFRMYEFKVKRCMRGRSHDWTECPFAHPGEKARRRDPRRFHYSGTACPDFRKGSCRRGDACEFAHGVFECWLHPARYRTQPCKDGRNCRRRDLKVSKFERYQEPP